MLASQLVVSGLSKSYHGRLALHEIDLKIAPNTVVGLIGGNGAGKTTLIRAVLDLIDIDHGSITIQDHDHRNPAARRAVSYLPERFLPSPRISGQRFLSIMAGLAPWQGLPNPGSDYAAACREFDLDPGVLRQPIGGYSKGMAQKLGLVASLIGEPEFIILDEPMSGLDPIARVHTRDALLKRKQAGASVLFSSHVLSDVGELCDQIAVMHKGHLLYDGETESFIDSCGIGKDVNNRLEAAYLVCVERHETEHLSKNPTDPS